MTLPKPWRSQTTDWFGGASMLFSGATMLTRNKYMGWGALLLALSSALNQKPMRTTESQTGGPLSSILFAVATLVTSYIPLFIINSQAQAALKTGTTTPLPT